MNQQLFVFLVRTKCQCHTKDNNNSRKSPRSYLEFFQKNFKDYYSKVVAEAFSITRLELLQNYGTIRPVNYAGIVIAVTSDWWSTVFRKCANLLSSSGLYNRKKLPLMR